MDASIEKYGASFNIMLPLRALICFDDIDPAEEPPVILNAALQNSWKDTVRKAVKEYAGGAGK